MTAPDNPNPVPLAQKLWTVENHNDEWRLVCNGKIQEIDGLSVFQHHLEALAIAINASLTIPKKDSGLDPVGKVSEAALPKQEERETPAEAYGRGVTAGKLEALKYTLEERERYGRWALGEKGSDVSTVPSQGQKPLSVVLDEIEHRVTRVIVFGRANVTGDAVSVDVFVDDCRSDIPALVKALRESRIWFLGEVGPDSYEHKAYDTKITTLLTSPAETEKDL